MAIFLVITKRYKNIEGSSLFTRDPGLSPPPPHPRCLISQSLISKKIADDVVLESARAAPKRRRRDGVKGQPPREIPRV